MNDDIIFKKIWTDNDIIEVVVICSSSVITVTSKIYVSNSLIDELIYQIRQFLDESIEEGMWENEDRGNDSPACISFRFLKKDRLGHIIIEVYAEIDDGGGYTNHNCCFYINTEHGLLLNFCDDLIKMKNCPEGFEICLNKFD